MVVVSALLGPIWNGDRAGAASENRHRPADPVHSAVRWTDWCGFGRFARVIGPVLVVALSALVAVRSTAMEMTRVGASGVGVTGGGGGSAASGEVALSIRQLGLRGRARAGDWTALQIGVLDSAPVSRELAVLLELPDADGDTVQYRIDLASSPLGRTVWMPLRLPPDTSGASARLRALLVEPGGRVVREVGSLQTRLPDALSPSLGLIGVVGPTRAGLDELAVGPGGIGGPDRLPTGHERTEIVDGLRVADLPDHWAGYAALSALVWAGAGEGVNPADLTDSQVAALRQWIGRGGHLVIVLTDATRAWPTDRRLADLFPRVSVARRDGVSLAEFTPLLRGLERPPERMRITGTVFTFRPEPDAGTQGFLFLPSVPAVPGERPIDVAARRLLGTGMVTVLGVDVTSPGVLQAGLVKTDAFWNRVLGRRGLTLSQAEVNRLSLQTGSGLRWRFPEPLDLRAGAEIEMTARAAVGVLASAALFTVYLILAGPVLYRWLRARGLARHTWVAFVGMTALFTAVTWAGVWVLKPSAIDARHLTFLDWVVPEPGQRPTVSARSWVNVYLPEHGSMTLSLPGEPAWGSGAISSWQPMMSPDASAGPARFPDFRSYQVDARSPTSIRVPTRSTVKALQLDWMGTPAWMMPAPVEGHALRVERVTEPGPVRWRVLGELEHRLPGPLREVTILVVVGSKPLGPIGDAPPVEGYAFSIAEWSPGERLDLGQLRLSTLPADKVRLEDWLESRSGQPPRTAGRLSAVSVGPQAFTTRRREALSMFAMLQPPDWQRDDQTSSSLLQRHATQALDRSGWLSHPCVVVLGHAEGALPVPLSVDGVRVEGSGSTMVRCLIPLTRDLVGRPEPAAGVPGFRKD
jgi:hypothetical protein